MLEPIIHSHETDGLPDEHPLALTNVHCGACSVMVHCNNNECMQTWIETYRGNFCTACMPLGRVLTIPWIEPFLSQRYFPETLE